MSRLELKTFVLGPLSTNCYLIFDRVTGKGFIIDAPIGVEKVISFIRKENIDIKFILLTHAHFDHIAGVDDFPEPFWVHAEDKPLLTDERLNGSLIFGLSVLPEKKANLFKENETVAFESYPIDVIHTPGHTPGSVSLKIGNWLFSGDTLFSNSVGRTDIPLSSYDALMSSINNKLMKLSDDIVVYPGHGPATTIGRERVNNPFICGES